MVHAHVEKPKRISLGRRGVGQDGLMSEFRFEYNGVVEWNLEIFDEMEKKITAIVREIFTLNHPTRLDLTQTVNDCFFVLRINKESNGIGFLF